MKPIIPIKIIVTGDKSCGKSALIRSIKKDVLGKEGKQMECLYHFIDIEYEDILMRAQFVEIEKEESIETSLIEWHGNDCILAVFDPLSPDSLSSLCKYLEQFNDLYENEETLGTLLLFVAINADKLSDTEIENFQYSYRTRISGSKIFLTSTKTNEGIPRLVKYITRNIYKTQKEFIKSYNYEMKPMPSADEESVDRKCNFFCFW